MLKKKIMAYVHQLLDHPSQWQTSQQAGPGSVPKFTSTSITVKQLLIENKNINQSKSNLLIWHYVSYLFLYKVGWSTVTSIRARPYAWTSLLLMMTNHRYLALFKDMFSFIQTKVFLKKKQLLGKHVHLLEVHILFNFLHVTRANLPFKRKLYLWLLFSFFFSFFSLLFECVFTEYRSVPLKILILLRSVTIAAVFVILGNGLVLCNFLCRGHWQHRIFSHMFLVTIYPCNSVFTLKTKLAPWQVIDM